LFRSAKGAARTANGAGKESAPHSVLRAFLESVLALFAVSTAMAQTGAQQNAAQIRARMEESLRHQNESVARQVQAARASQPRGAPPVVVARPLRPVLSTLRACDPISPGSFDPQIRAEADRQGVAPELLRAVISAESDFIPCAVSDKGAMGLMQLMPGTAAAMGVSDPMDPNDNLRGGVRYLGQLLERYGGDLRLALGAYNAGPALVDKFGDVPPIPETQNYVREILRKLTISPPVAPKP
jgi:soluble lytic murein transglycosylase-like protein